MGNEIIHLKSIAELHQTLGFAPPLHPLISVIDVRDLVIPENMVDLIANGYRVMADLYMISRKDGSCGMRYGRNLYDFESGVLTFTAPGQVMQSVSSEVAKEGWMLFFHPDLIRRTHLGQQIEQYNFFSYDVYEALHLSDREQDMIDGIVRQIEYEYSERIDRHSGTIFASHLEVLLNYCLRFYERQFNTRQPHHADLLGQVEDILRSYYSSEQPTTSGTPTVQYLAEQVHLSPNYLSDVLRKETGRNAKDHINGFVVNRAKSLLLNSDRQISEIAYDLGFNYPHYFSRLFKQKTGMSPQEFRQADLN